MLNNAKVSGNIEQLRAPSLADRESLTIALLGLVSPLLVGCQERRQEAAAAQSVSYKTRAEHASAKVEKEYRLSETETIKVVIVPGFPMGERCVIYTNVQTSAMQCREITP